MSGFAQGQGLTEFPQPDQGRDTGADHAAHAGGKTCAKCGELITARQPARRWREADWVHDVCPDPAG